MACLMKRGFALVAVFVLLAWTVPAPGPAYAEESFAKSRLTIVSANGGRHRFTVEIASTPEQRAQGLQGRRQLAAAAGMLFDFGRIQPVFMWMKNTYLPLDMIFIRNNGRIVNIAPETTPESLAIIESAGLVKAVLEVPAGTAARLGIKAGDRVEHRIFE